MAHPKSPTGGAGTIRLADLSLVLAAHKLRRQTRGFTPQLCVFTERPVIEVDCFNGRPNSWLLQQAKCCRPVRFAAPLGRGHIARLMDRVQRQQGRREVLKTWGVGIRALLAEPKYTLNGGAR